MADINIGGTLHSVAVGNVVARTNEILDPIEGKKQQQLNQEFKSGIENAGMVDDIQLNGVSIVDQYKVASLTIEVVDERLVIQ